MTPYRDSEVNSWDFGFGLSYGAPLPVPAAYNQAPQTAPDNKGIGPNAIGSRKQVRFDYNGNGKADFIKIVHSGEKVSDLVDPLPVNQGYTLQGWNKGDRAYNFDDPVTEDMSLTANWIRN